MSSNDSGPSNNKPGRNPFFSLFDLKDFSIRIPRIKDQKNIDRLIKQEKNLRNKSPKMATENLGLELKDVITAIPIFSGNRKDLDTFTNTCDLYVELISPSDRPHLIKIIKTKITGEALAKISPIASLTTWPEIRKKLKEKINKTITVEYAREDLNNVKQFKDESIEAYSNRIRGKLRSLNEAVKEMTESDTEITVIRKINEKQAINKFEQHIRNNTLRMMVSAAAKDSLDECIAFALQKEISFKPNMIQTCSHCGMNNHDTMECRRRNNNNNFRKDFKKPFAGNSKGESSQSHNTSSFSDNTGRHSNNNGRNTNYNGRSFGNNGKKFGNNKQNQNNIKAIKNDDDNITLRDIIEQNDEDSSYQINNFQKIKDHIGGNKYCEIKFIMKNNEVIIEIPTSISDEKI